MIQLTNEEINHLNYDWYSIIAGSEDSEEFRMHVKRVVAQAQLKKVAEWGYSSCNIPGHNNPGEVVFKHNCQKCWQALLEEVKG